MRVFRAWVKPGKESAYERLVREQIVPQIRGQPGVLSIHAGKMVDHNPGEILVISVWKDLDSLKAFAGPDWQKPIAVPGEADLVDKTQLEHYEGIEAPGDVM